MQFGSLLDERLNAEPRLAHSREKGDAYGESNSLFEAA